MFGWTWLITILVVVFASGAPRAEADTAASTRSVADELLQRWAPVYVQHVAAGDDGADRPTRIDFDGNWDTTDNWERQAQFRTALSPAAYGAAVLTDTHAYLTYTLYYPRDWHRRICVSFLCHDNDLETIQLVVDRSGAAHRLVEVRTKAHLSLTDTSGDDVARTADGRPLLWVEGEGHGVSICRRDDPACTARTGRIVYAPGSVASEPPAAAMGQTVSYKLLSLHETLWARRQLSNPRLWTDGETGPLFYRGHRLGRLGFPMGAALAGARYLGGVRPPWAIKGLIGARGDWFLDPAGAHGSAIDSYVYNPFLDDLAAECRGQRCTAGPARERSRTEYFVRLGAPYLLVSLGAIVLNGWLRRRGGAQPFSPHTLER